MHVPDKLYVNVNLENSLIIILDNVKCETIRYKEEIDWIFMNYVSVEDFWFVQLSAKVVISNYNYVIIILKLLNPFILFLLLHVYDTVVKKIPNYSIYIKILIFFNDTNI